MYDIHTKHTHTYRIICKHSKTFKKDKNREIQTRKQKKIIKSKQNLKLANIYLYIKLKYVYS